VYGGVKETLILLWFIGFLVLTYVVLIISKTIKQVYGGVKETLKFILNLLKQELLTGAR